MAAGDGLTPRQQERIEQAVETARRENGLDISVLVGDLELDDLSQFRAASERLHAALGERSPSAVLFVVAPGQRRVEVVTGPAVRRRVPDRVSALGAVPVELDLLERRLTVAGSAHDLTEREFQLLESLMRHPGQVLSREQLLDLVWGFDFAPGSNVVDVYIAQLRTKVGRDRIETVRGAGYVFARKQDADESPA